LLDGVDFMHQRKLLHLDIKPANILIRADNNPLLLDFGAIRYFSQQQQKPLSKVVTNGFSPIEQYDMHGQIGPWTDIYSVGASMRACMDGKAPQSSVNRLKYDEMQSAVIVHRKKYPEYLLKAVDWAMALLAKDRPQSVTQFRQAINPDETL
jgi:serine/threonine protein kinase